MTTRMNSYLSFPDTAKPAMEFYQSVFGGDLTVTTFGELQAADDPAERDKVMHSTLTTDGGFVLMAADTPAGMQHTPGTSHSMSLSGDDEAELRGYWDKLAADGTVDDAAGEGTVGRHVRDVHRPLRRAVAGEHHRRAVLARATQEPQ